MSAREPVVYWEQDIAFEGPSPALACVVGDLDPARAGEEIAVACRSGEALMLFPEGGGWGSELIFQAGGEVDQCEVGDLDPRHPGAELVLAGRWPEGEGSFPAMDEPDGPFVIFVSARTEEWGLEAILEDDATIQAIAVGDLDPDQPGDELVVACAAHDVHLLSFDQGNWKFDRIGGLPADATSASCDGGRAYVGCADGSILAFELGAGGWSGRSVGVSDRPIAGIAARRGEILCSTSDGTLRLTRGGTEEIVHRSPAGFHGAVIAELVRAWPGPEYATAREDGAMVVVHTGASSGWIATQVAQDTLGLRDLAVGWVGDARAALVCAGASGQVIVAWPTATGR